MKWDYEANKPDEITVKSGDSVTMVDHHPEGKKRVMLPLLYSATDLFFFESWAVDCGLIINSELDY